MYIIWNDFIYQLRKTEVIHQPTSGSPNIGPDIHREGQVVTRVIKFKYLCSIVAKNNWLDSELYTRNSNHSYASSGLKKWVWVKWWQRIRNKLILERYKLPGKYSILAKLKLKWAAHLKRLKNKRPLKQILYSQLRKGFRRHVDQDSGIMTASKEIWGSWTFI